MLTLDAAATDILDRLGDTDESIWTRAEISLYIKDGYSLYTRQTKCLFDRWVIENVPPTANWQTDLEKYFALQNPGWGVTDMPFHFTGNERNFGTGGVGGTYRGPSGITNPGQIELAVELGDVPTTVFGGILPDGTVEVLRVVYDDRELTGMSSMQMRQLDVNYETRAGEPQYFVWDKDGINFLRLVPGATGEAVYPTINGSWGTQTETDDTTITPEATATGGYGILVHVTGDFPTYGPWGSPTQRHPSSANTEVDIIREGRNLDSNPFEIPPAFAKYPLYWAMSEALRREGPGQDLKLAEHYAERYAMGVTHMHKKTNQLAPEEHHRFRPPNSTSTFGIGDPVLPSAYPRAF
jgi:hypothetical protein